jgi:hypothetical protein
MKIKHNYNVYSSPNIKTIKSRTIKWACSMHGQVRNMYEMLVRKPEGKEPLERPRHRYKDNIKMELKETG